MGVLETGSGESGWVFARMSVSLRSLLVSVALVAACISMSAPALAAKYAAIVIDTETGEVLFARQPDEPRYPASLTKMMTLYLTFSALEQGELRLDTKIPVSQRAARQSPSRLGLNAGERISVENVILALVTKSANDAAAALGEAMAGTEQAFAVQMTRTAQRLGMLATTFRNSSGLPHRQQRSTARDLAILAQALMADFPRYYHYFSIQRFTYKKRTFRNHNRLLRSYDGVDGIKTGYIRASGFNVAVSAERDGKRLVAVVLGGKTSRSRDAHTRQLLDQAFARIEAPWPATKPTPAELARTETERTEPPEVSPTTIEVAELTKGSGDDWAVQVGAFSTIAQAQRQVDAASRAAPQLLADTRIAIVDAPRALYRARLVGLSEGEARQACETLRGHDIDCLPVPPSGPLSQGDR